MYALCEKHGLPIPKTRVKIGIYEADFLFGERVVIETDGWETHGTRQAFEDDREREIELALLGYEVHRITWRQIVNRPAWVASSLRTILHRTD
jgi:very-short-patch-repair endonuclease